MRISLLILVVGALALGPAPTGLPAGERVLVLDDALQGSTTGTRSGGKFVVGGWQVTGKNDTIYWHVPTITNGAAEFDVRGLRPNERRAGMEDKTELFHMYDHTAGNADGNYVGGYRENPFKHFIRKIGALDAAKADAMEIVWQIQPNYKEPDTARLSWAQDTAYHFREEWAPDGAGNSVLKLYRNGELLLTTSVPGQWRPVGHAVRIGASPRRDVAAGAPVGAVFSNVKVWNLAGGSGLVRLKGRSFCDDDGPFLGLGASYFQALRHAKYDRRRLNANLALLASKGFNYVRILSMVSWDGLEIAPVSFANRGGRRVEAWPDYWQQFRDLLELAGQHGLRVEVTAFADAQYVMPSQATRQAHLDGILANIAGREHRVLFLEVANEAWQNGFPGPQGVADLRRFAQYLADRTSVPVAITSNDDTTDQGIMSLYRGSAADLATVHFSRDTRTAEGGWLPVRDPYRAGNLPGVPPAISNEPIGPGSSVASESEPIKLCSAAVFAYLANLPAYVYHSRAGIYGYVRCCPPGPDEIRFENSAGINAYRFIRQILPPDLAGWTRNDGLEPAAPLTVFCGNRPNRYWPEADRPTDGCVRNIGSVKGSEFLCFPMGILRGGVALQARRPVRFQVFHPLTGAVERNVTLDVGERATLPQGPGAYICKGRFLDAQRTPAASGGSAKLARRNVVAAASYSRRFSDLAAAEPHGELSSTRFCLAANMAGSEQPRPHAGIAKSPMIFPGKHWASAGPEAQGVDPAKLQAAIDYLAGGLKEYGGAGTLFIVRNGYVIWSGPECDRQHPIYSATKSFTSTVLGLLIDDGKVTLGTLAKDLDPALAKEYPAVTLRHFATMTSGYDSVGGSYEFDREKRGDSWNPGPPAPPLFPPGSKFRYWDDAMMQFGSLLTKAAGEPLDRLLKRRIADPIGMADWRWTENDSPVGRVLSWTGGISTSSRELARFGHLFLNGGTWSGRQLISASWVDQASSVQVPASIPNDDLPRSRGAGVYGYNWWVNGVKPNGRRLWPGAPPRTYYANGLHNNVCIVVPEWNMVIARTNGAKKGGGTNSPPNVDEIWSGFFSRLREAVGLQAQR